MSQQKMFKCTIMRTGTSKSVYFKANELPENPEEKDKIILAALGSPDPKQIDGLGGGEGSTSKIAIVSVSKRPDADIDYTFGQVSLNVPFIDYSGNCGNCSSGIGPYVIDESMVPITEPITTVRIYNTNTKKLIIEHVRVVNQKAAVDGECIIDGVPGSSAQIDLDFRDAVGAATGKLLPTNNRQDELFVPNVGKIPVTIVDLGNPVVFFHAKFVQATGLENRPQINGDNKLLERIEAIRDAAAKLICLVPEDKIAKEFSPMRPLVVMFAEPQDCVDYVSKNIIPGDQVDFVARNLMNQSAIETFAATAALCTGVASVLKGSVLNEVSVRRNPESNLICFGNPRGITDVHISLKENDDNTVDVEQAIMTRTARRIMDGYVYIRESVLN